MWPPPQSCNTATKEVCPCTNCVRLLLQNPQWSRAVTHNNLTTCSNPFFTGRTLIERTVSPWCECLLWPTSCVRAHVPFNQYNVVCHECLWSSDSPCLCFGKMCLLWHFLASINYDKTLKGLCVCGGATAHAGNCQWIHVFICVCNLWPWSISPHSLFSVSPPVCQAN